MTPTTTEWTERPEALAGTVTMAEMARALSRAAVQKAENWSWPPRPTYGPLSGAPEPTRAAFCRFLESGEPYHRGEEI